MTLLELFTTVTRTDAAGDPVEYEAIVHFSATTTSPGCPACYYQNNGDPGWPAEGPEYEFTFESAELDPNYKGQPPLTDAELATLRTWFVTHDDEARESANDNEPAGPDPDAARDRGLDDRMTGGWRGLEA